MEDKNCGMKDSTSNLEKAQIQQLFLLVIPVKIAKTQTVLNGSLKSGSTIGKCSDQKHIDINL